MRVDPRICRKDSRRNGAAPDSLGLAAATSVTRSQSAAKSAISLSSTEVHRVRGCFGVIGKLSGSVSGDTLPPKEFKPVGLAFVTGSLSAPGMVEAYEHKFPKDHPLRALYVPGINMLLKHGVDPAWSTLAAAMPHESSRAIESRSGAPRFIRRYGRTWLRRGSRGVGFPRDRIRWHSAAARTKRACGWRAAELPGAVEREVVGERGESETQTRRSRR